MDLRKRSKLIELLRRGTSITREEISEILDIHPRTVSRYIKRLKEENPAMRLKYAKEKGYIVVNPPENPPPGLFVEEAILLIFSIKSIRDISPIERKVTMDKLLNSLLIPSYADEVRKLLKGGFLGTNQGYQYHKIAKAFKAYISKEILLFDYRSSKEDKVKRHGIFVIGINIEKGKIYITGIQTKTGYITNYRLPRMENLVVFPKSKELSFNYEDFLNKNVKMFSPGEKKYEVKLSIPFHLSKSILSRFPEAIVEPDAKEEKRTIVTFETSSLEGTFHWLWQFGSVCRVLAPEKLLSLFKGEINEMRRIYKLT
ncbi:MAG: helix-turn-helix transcriptional regulator [Candidatus Syntropharchaeia archaeon]